MNELIKREGIAEKIYQVRSVQVMLDKDIAALYEVKPIRLREQVQRNIERFPEDFMFRLTDSEVDTMVSQNAIPSRQHLGGSLPYVFTKTISKQLALDLKKHNEQYPPISIHTLKDSHDQFLLIDHDVYHIGASLKDLGKKWFAFSKMDQAGLKVIDKIRSHWPNEEDG